MKSIGQNERGKFAGMLQILRFNSHLYAGAVVLLAACWLVVITADVKGVFLALIVSGSGLAMFWMTASLWASHWVYDRSEVYRWTWIAGLFPKTPRQWLNIHAGLDESSAALRTIFPRIPGVVFDMFNPATMTERSIEKARRMAEASTAQSQVDFQALPLPDGEADAIFLIFVAHELRPPAARALFFAELRRALAGGGQIVLVEHLRDWKNFAVFGPGFTHFFSANQWRQAAHRAGLVVELEIGMTPFVRIFILRRPA